jgi:uncharacterized protein
MKAGREPRTYRTACAGEDLRYFSVVVAQTDLRIGVGHGSGRPMPSEKDLLEARQQALKEVVRCRQAIEAQIREQPSFLSSLVPLVVAAGSPEIVLHMAAAAQRADVGPMAAVAGAVAELVGNRMCTLFSEVVVENGGDLWLRGTRPRLVGVWCGQSILNGKLALRVSPSDMPLGLCTSSATVGHSLSLGRTDAATIAAGSAALADAVATALGNRVKTASDLEAALTWALGIPDVRGALVIVGEQVGIKGMLELVPVAP